MKETTTIYKCTCGREFDNKSLALFHAIFCPGSSMQEDELTQAEYLKWTAARTA